MPIRPLLCLLLGLNLVSSLAAGEIRGVVMVKRKLTKSAATPAFDSYARGIVVSPVAVTESDPLVYERTHTVIYLDGDPATAVAAMTKSIDQENRTFVPDLVVVPAGSSISFPNLDPIFHNVFSLSKAKSFDLGNYSKGQTRSVTFDRPGVVLVNCRIHTNMGASIVVTPNGFYAAPDRDGAFSIKDVPPGKYTVVAWHKSAGFFRKNTVVVEEESSTVDFFIPLGSDGDSRRGPPRK